MRAIVIDDSPARNIPDFPFPCNRLDEVEVYQSIDHEECYNISDINKPWYTLMNWVKSRFIILGDLTPVEEEVEEEIFA